MSERKRSLLDQLVEIYGSNNGDNGKGKNKKGNGRYDSKPILTPNGIVSKPTPCQIQRYTEEQRRLNEDRQE